jgi:hypothetical protein
LISSSTVANAKHMPAALELAHAGKAAAACTTADTAALIHDCLSLPHEIRMLLLLSARFGKFSRILDAGLHFLIPVVSSRVGLALTEWGGQLLQQLLLLLKTVVPSSQASGMAALLSSCCSVLLLLLPSSIVSARNCA